MDTKRKYNLDELLKVAKAGKQDIIFKDISPNVDEATRFVIAFDIREGKNKVRSTLIYKAYKTWSPDPTSSTSFLRNFTLLFENKKSSDGAFYFINYKPAELLNEAAKMKQNEKNE